MSIYDIAGLYGKDWKHGVLIDDIDKASENDCHIIPTKTDRSWVVPYGGGVALPVVCGDIIEVEDLEGYRTDGRCGLPILASRGACEGHADERDHWLAASESEKRFWERSMEM